MRAADDGVHRNAARGRVSSSPSINAPKTAVSGGYHGDDHSRRHSHSSVHVGLFAGGGGWGFGVGYSNTSGRYYDDGYSSTSFAYSFGYGGGPWYARSSFHAVEYSPCWNYHYYGAVPAYSLITVGPSYGAVTYGPAYGQYVEFRHRSRYHFGFTYYYPYATYTPYPFYRVTYYEPYYLSSYSVVCPTYRTYYYTRARSTVSYVETCDPYVEAEEVVTIEEYEASPDSGLSVYGGSGGGAPIATVSADVGSDIPDAFAASLVAGFPDGLDYDDLLAWGEDALFAADYLSSAEAFRRAAVARWTEDYPKFQFAVALFGCGQYDRAVAAIEFGLDQNPAWLSRRFSLATAFANPGEFAARTNALERFLIENDSASGARYLLGYVYFYSDNQFGARSVFKTLEDKGFQSRHFAAMVDESERRLTQKE